MRNVKKLGKGLEDISYLFISSPEENSPVEQVIEHHQPQKFHPPAAALKAICLIGDDLGSESSFLIINLSLALARLGMKIAVLDMNEQFPCLEFFTGNRVTEKQIDSPEQLVKEGPLGVKLVGLNQIVLEKFSDNENINKLYSLLSKIEEEVDLILGSVLPKNFLIHGDYLSPVTREFLVLVDANKEKMIDAYKIIKNIFHNNPAAKIGVIVADVEKVREVEAVYDKMQKVVRKFLNKELYKYGFLYKLKPDSQIDKKYASFYDADLTACISNIAQIVILRSSLSELPLGPDSFFKTIISALTTIKTK